MRAMADGQPLPVGRSSEARRKEKKKRRSRSPVVDRQNTVGLSS